MRSGIGRHIVWYIHGYKCFGVYLHRPSDDGGSMAGQIVCTHHLDYTVP